MNDEKRDMLFRTKDGNYRRPKKVEGSAVNTSNANRNKRRLTYLGDDYYYDQEVRTGECYICKREGWAQRSRRTVLHHLKYEHSDPLAWTLEVCSKCHWQIDEYNRKAIERSTGKKIERPYGKYDNPYYENREQKEKRRKDDWMRFVRNTSQGYYYLKTNEKIPESVIRKWKNMYSKKETMSSVSSRYFMPKTEE